MSVRTAFAKAALKGALSATLLFSTAAGLSMMANHDLDDAPAVDNAVTADYRARLQQLGELKNTLSDKEYGWAVDDLAEEIWTDTRLNEQTVMALSKYFPEDRAETAYALNPYRIDSLDECRAKSESDSAFALSYCANENNGDSSSVAKLSFGGAALACLLLLLTSKNPLESAETKPEKSAKPAQGPSA